MYESKMVCCLKANGKVLREHKDTVYVPFGTEYSILIKNLNSVRAMVNISIDGKDIADGKADFIVNANTEIDLTRFLSGGNMDKGNKFKFIERTPGIEQHRGVGVEDGIIRIEFQFERQYAGLVPSTDYWRDKVYYCDPGYNTLWNTTIGTANSSVLRSSGVPANDHYGAVASAAYSTNDSYADKGPDVTNVTNVTNVYAQSLPTSITANDVGITVPGSVSEQKFQSVSGFALDGVKHVMVLRLVGETPEGKKIVEPVTVKAKPKCVTCGRVNKAGAKFCTECGTSLQIV